MRNLLIVLALTFSFSSPSGADVIKTRDTANSFRILLTGADAEPLMDALGKQAFRSSGQIAFVLCSESVGCEIHLKSDLIQTFEQTEEQLKLAAQYGISEPQVQMPKNSKEELVYAQLTDSPTAGRLYNLMPGPEVPMNLSFSKGNQNTVKTKSLNFAQAETFFSCQQSYSSMRENKDYRCVVSAIVPSGR